MRPQDFTRHDSRAVLAGRAGGLSRAVETKQQALGRIALAHLGHPVDAVSAAYDLGYKAGHAAKMKAIRREVA